MEDATAIKIAAILAITILEAIAIVVLKIDGVLLSGVIAVIAGLAGYTVGTYRAKKEIEGT